MCGTNFGSGANFNSHAHVERDDVFARNARHPIISTHTLTWSVTIFFGTQMKQNFISTHTLTWSVT